jgi:hypothetical protein
MNELYKVVYKLGQKLPKRDRFGIHSKIESLCLEVLAFAIQAALVPKDKKAPYLQELRRDIEVMKYLIRLCMELGIIDTKKYWQLQKQLQEISKMAAGWLKYSI